MSTLSPKPFIQSYFTFKYNALNTCSAFTDGCTHLAITSTVHLTQESDRMPPLLKVWEAIQENYNTGGKSAGPT